MACLVPGSLNERHQAGGRSGRRPFLERDEPKFTREWPSSNRHGAQLFAQEARNAAPGRDRQSNAGTHEAEHRSKLGDGHDVIQGQTLDEAATSMTRLVLESLGNETSG